MSEMPKYLGAEYRLCDRCHKPMATLRWIKPDGTAITLRTYRVDPKVIVSR